MWQFFCKITTTKKKTKNLFPLVILWLDRCPVLVRALPGLNQSLLHPPGHFSHRVGHFISWRVGKAHVQKTPVGKKKSKPFKKRNPVPKKCLDIWLFYFHNGTACNCKENILIEEMWHSNAVYKTLCKLFSSHTTVIFLLTFTLEFFFSPLSKLTFSQIQEKMHKRSTLLVKVAFG